MASVEIVEAQLKDAAALAVIHGRAFKWGWDEFAIRGLLEKPTVVGLTALSRRSWHPVGFLLSRHAADEAEILTVATDPGRRQRGVGTQLGEICVARLWGRGVQRIFLEVAEDNVAALALYTKLHFEPVGRRSAYYPHPEGRPGIDAVILERRLAAN